ncbi:hypothetical protein [Streptomyces sp. NPDC057280]|uniref:hypothetical protein n=1 Tax=Streptomyces sp. NPDC057280 TaxID=3346081 RepID=UPI0036309B88
MRDEHDRPVQLRSVYGTRLWQLPGGTLDAPGEDPLQTGEQFGRIRLDPAEHDMWAIHDLATWQELMAPRAFARLDAVERARRGEGPAYLITHT